jgi:hypothetical protein
MKSQIDSWHRKISTGQHFQNGHHNTAQIEHCPISTTFHMWVDYDVPNWFLTSKNFYRSPFSKWPPQYCTIEQDMIIISRLWSFPNRPLTTGLKNKLKATFEIQQCWIFAVLWRPLGKWRPVEIFRCRESIQDIEIEQCWIYAVLWWPFWKWRPVEIFRCQESIRDMIIYSHMKCRWNRSMLNVCGIVVAILKMATGRNISMSGINSGHDNLPTYSELIPRHWKISTGGHF